MNNKQRHRIKRVLKRKNPKLFWFTPLWKLQFKGKGLLITQDMVEKAKLISNDAYLMVRKERFLQGLPKK